MRYKLNKDGWSGNGKGEMDRRISWLRRNVQEKDTIAVFYSVKVNCETRGSEGQRNTPQTIEAEPEVRVWAPLLQQFQSPV